MTPLKEDIKEQEAFPGRHSHASWSMVTSSLITLLARKGLCKNWFYDNVVYENIKSPENVIFMNTLNLPASVIVTEKPHQTVIGKM